MQTFLTEEWIERVIHSKSADEIDAHLKAWPGKRDLSLVEDLTEAVVKYSRKNVEATMNLALAAMSTAHELAEMRATALAQRAMGNAEQVRGNYKAAADYYQSSIEKFESLNDEVELARTLSSSVGVLIYLSEYDQGLAMADRAKAIFERHQDSVRLARLEVNRGNLLHRLDRFQEAIDCYDRALEVLKDTHDYEAIAGIKSNRATCLIVLNRFGDALKNYQEARAFCEQHQMPLLVAQADYNIAYLYYLRGQYTRALEMLSTARTTSQHLNNLQHLALCDLDQSEILLELNMSREAIEFSERAAQSFEQMGMRYEQAKALTISATAQAQVKNLFKALEMFEQARAMFEVEGNRVWVAMVDLYKATLFYSLGRHFEALDLCRRALDHFRLQRLISKAVYAEILKARILMGLGDAHQALESAKAATAALGVMNAPWLNYQAYYTLALTQESLGDLPSAEKGYTDAIAFLETMRGNIIADEMKINFFKDKLTVYERLVALCLDNPRAGRVGEAFAYVERAKSRALVDLLSSAVGQVRRAKPSSSEIVDHLQLLREELNWFYRKVNLEEGQGKLGDEGRISEMRELIHQRETQLAKILRRLPAEDEEYASLHSVQSVATEQIQQSLTGEQTLIEFYVIQNRIVAFLVTRDRVKFIPHLSDLSQVKNDLDLLKYQLSKFNFGAEYVSNHQEYLKKSIDTHLADLYRSLLQPLESELTGRELIIVPHDVLHYVPFHALKQGEDYLIDCFNVSYSPSASIFKLCSSKPRSTKKNSLVMGIPDERLPHVVDEIEAVSTLLPNSTLLVGGAATEEKLKSLGAGASILHIASHGVFRDDNPMFSSIQLGTSWLNLFDIYNIELDSDLVTLSGCGTGMSRVVDGDELIGLVRGFLYAGTRSLLVSLWNVNDRSASELMRAFYRRFHESENITQSLRLAMQETKAHYPHPYYWAPFVLMGKTHL